MAITDSNIVLLLINSLLYFSAFFLFQRKIKSLQVGSIVYLLYAIISVGSVYLYWVNPIWDFQEITLFPFIYLFVVLMIAFKPLSVLTNNKVIGMKFPDQTIMNTLSIIIFLVYFAFFIQTILSSFSIVDLMDMDVLVDNYEDKYENIKPTGVINIFGVLKNIFSDMLWIFAMYNIVKKKRILSLFVLSAISIEVFAGFAGGARGTLTSVIMGMPISYILFRPLMSEKQKKAITTVLIVIIALISIGFFGLTFGRFGDQDRYSILEIMIYYLSSNFIMFNNYALNPGGCRYGDRVFPLVRKILGLDTADGYMDRRDKFPQLQLDDSQFSFFVGEFCIDFGPIFAFVIITFFSYIFYRTLKKKQYDLGDILVGAFLCRILCMGFTLFKYSEISGNLGILYVLFFTWLFKKFTHHSLKINDNKV